MIKFKVDYLKEHNAISLSATIGEESATTAFFIDNDDEKFVKMLELSLDKLINGKRSDMQDGKLIMKEPLSKGLLI